jgi:hypothetical protein
VRDYVLAIDPGKATGLAWYDVMSPDSFRSVELGFMDACGAINRYAATYGDQIDIVAETFLITVQTAKNTQATWSLEVIGVAKYLALKHTGAPAIMQQQSEAKTFSTNDRLRAIGWYAPGLRNANDAAKHLLRYLVKHGWWDDRLGPKYE